MKCLRKFIVIFSFVLIADVSAYETDVIPHVSKKAQDSYEFDYSYADTHRAFAIAAGGAWSWKSGYKSAEKAAKEAIATCQGFTQQKCMLYALDDKVVFDQQAWTESWGPYKTRAQASKAKTGTRLGEKFYDVSFTDPQGKHKSISDLRGKVVFVHFWGCWCPSCRKEFGTLIDAYRILKDTMNTEVELVILQVRESIDTAKQWTKKHNLTELPISDSGVKNEEDHQLSLKNGRKIKDRELAKVFPASYILDKNGIVVFSHMGSIHDWTEYIPFYKDVATRSTR